MIEKFTFGGVTFEVFDLFAWHVEAQLLLNDYHLNECPTYLHRAAGSEP